MRSNEYHFVTRWRVRGSVGDVAAVIGNAVDLPRWWPSVYLRATELEPGDAAGVGKVIDLHTRGWLPYTLRWRFRVVEADAPRSFGIEAKGDFEGAGRWTFAQDGDEVDVTYDWRIRARKPLLRWLSWALKPVFSANHRWAMERGRGSLEIELARLRGDDHVPAPPGPGPRIGGEVVGFAMAAAVGAGIVLWCSRRNRRH